MTYYLVESSAHVLHAVIAGQVATACGRRGHGWQVVMGRHVRAGRFCRPCLRGLQRAVKSGGAKEKPGEGFPAKSSCTTRIGIFSPEEATSPPS
jgi:hypothetical protein